MRIEELRRHGSVAIRKTLSATTGYPPIHRVPWRTHERGVGRGVRSSGMATAEYSIISGMTYRNGNGICLPTCHVQFCQYKQGRTRGLT